MCNKLFVLCLLLTSRSVAAAWVEEDNEISCPAGECSPAGKETSGSALLQKTGNMVSRTQQGLGFFDEEDEFEAAYGLRSKAPEQYQAGDLDCADEVVLRTQFAESFEVPDLDECMKTVDEQYEAKFKKYNESGGSGSGKGGTGSGWNEKAERAKIAGRCITKQGHGIALGPRLVRMTFHDAADYNNLMFQNGTEAPAHMGAVDSCLHMALISTGLDQKGSDEPSHTDEEEPGEDEDDEVAKGDPNHNRGLRNAELWVKKMASLFGLEEPDAQVLGATVALEAWFGGPEVGLSFGRKRGHCNKMICANEKCIDRDTPFFKQAVAEPVGTGMMCPMTNTISGLEKLMELNTSMLVALQGAHSIGGVIVCSGLGNVASGPFCPSKCGLPTFDQGNLDGTTFDDTPGKLDNRYYQLLTVEDYSNLPDCEFAKMELPQLSKRGFKERGGKDDTCAAGITYTPESQCDVEACVDKCAKTPVCQEAQNVDDADHILYKKAWEKCIECRVQCSPQHTLKTAFREVNAHVKTCVKPCVTKGRTCVKGCRDKLKAARKACKKKKGKERRACMVAAKKDFRTGCIKACGPSNGAACKASCAAEHPLGKHLTAGGKGKLKLKGERLPARWCKRMSAQKQCLDADVKLPINGGWGDCPEDKRMSFPNLGQGRLTIIQNLERYTSFRGLKKRLMVLPADWSYLASPKHKEWFQKYADDNDLFLKNFAYAWRSVSEKGWKGKLQQCTAVKCTVGGDGSVTCPIAHKPMGEMKNASLSSKQFVGTGPKSERPKELKFTNEQCEGAVPQDAKDCSLVGGRGVRAKLVCGAATLYCCYAAGCAAEAEIKKEWTKGGQQPTCNEANED
eukprot:gnl/TRDRNA2_/TRDRNA2_176596_c3_seq1.p1 gnl/TRDRNA2_/TRDRNA2_176596_c3~~gnl/TRDRNA2_/TRDRNA2_176596_c3_seq1.p1  ORF type:complete len:850 (-),score=183.59 gnl/TRDRNA2_/TRDRNA2_176596_c3_seq1:249-2798(-)